MVDDKILSLLEKIDKKIDDLAARNDKKFDDLSSSVDKKIDALSSRIGAIEDYLKTETITKAEGLRMVETLEGISEAFAQQAATKAEDKADATYEMLSSLIEGSNQRLLDRMDQQTKQVLNSLKPLDKILSLLVEKDERQDFALSTLEQRLRFLERRLGNEK